MAGTHQTPGAQLGSAPAPAGVVDAMVPGYDPAAGPPTGRQQHQARVELERLRRTHQGAGRQLVRLDQEGAAVEALGDILDERGAATRRERSDIAAARGEQRSRVGTQQRRFTTADTRLAEVARRAGAGDRSRPGAAITSPFADPFPPPAIVVGVAVDALGNHRRATSTLADAAERHWNRAARFERAGRPGPAARHRRLAERYLVQSARLGVITDERAPLKSVPDVVQRVFAAAPADRLPKGNAAIRTIRRGATKVGWPSVAGLAVDAGMAAARGDSVSRAAASGGISVAAGSVAGGLTAAGIAATVPGPGWAVAGGIVVSTGVAWAVKESGVADWAGDKIVGLFE